MSEDILIKNKKDKVFKIVNYVLMIVLALTCVGLGIYYYVIGDPNNRLLASVGVTLLFVLPMLVELIFRCRISNLILLFYTIYSFLAGLLGCLLNFYNTSGFGLDVWYDIFIHTLAGYVFSLIGLIVVSKFEKYKNLNPWTVLFFCFCFTLAIELIWELMEWFADSCLGQQSQGHPPVGQPAPLVTDTNIDMLCNFSGAVLFAIHFIVGKFTKAKVGIKFIEKEFCENKIFSRKLKKSKQNKASEENNNLKDMQEPLLEQEEIKNEEK